MKTFVISIIVVVTFGICMRICQVSLASRSFLGIDLDRAVPNVHNRWILLRLLFFCAKRDNIKLNSSVLLVDSRMPCLFSCPIYRQNDWPFTVTLNPLTRILRGTIYLSSTIYLPGVKRPGIIVLELSVAQCMDINMTFDLDLWTVMSNRLHKLCIETDGSTDGPTDIPIDMYKAISLFFFEGEGYIYLEVQLEL